MPKETLTIAGQTFTAPNRYEEGHELTANEASALNQTYHENLRNNFASKVKEAVEAGSFDANAFQSKFDEYALAYQFGVRAAGGGGVSRDPVMSEAMRIAKAIIRQKLKAKGRKITEVEPSAITEAAKTLIERDEKILETAKANVAEQQAAASADLEGLVASLPAKAPKAA